MYTVKVMEPGIVLEVIENGVKTKKKLMGGEIVQIEKYYKEDLESGYYKLIRQELVHPKSKKIIRKRQTEEPKENKLDDVFNKINNTFNTIVDTIEIKPKPKPEKKVPIVDQKGDLPEEYYTEEDSEDDYQIISKKQYKEINKTYSDVIKNTMRRSLGEGRFISESGDLSKKNIPKISEANLGRMIDDEEKIMKMNIPGVGGASVNIVKDPNGEIDVAKSLGINIINAPSNKIITTADGIEI